MRIVFCRGGLGFALFGDDVWRGEPIWLSKDEQYDVPEELGDWKTSELSEAEGLGAASSMLLKEFLVGNDSASTVANREVEKFGTPHWKQIQLTLCVPLKTGNGIFIHLT